MGGKEEVKREGASQAEGTGKGQLAKTCSATAIGVLLKPRERYRDTGRRRGEADLIQDFIGRKAGLLSQRLALELDGGSGDPEERAGRGYRAEEQTRPGLAADAPSPQAGSAWTWATPCAAAAAPASRGRVASTTWTTAPAAPAPTAARAWRVVARDAAPAHWASAAVTAASAPTRVPRAPAPTAAAATPTSPASSAPARPATWARAASFRFTPSAWTTAQARCPRPYQA